MSQENRVFYRCAGAQKHSLTHFKTVVSCIFDGLYIIQIGFEFHSHRELGSVDAQHCRLVVMFCNYTFPVMTLLLAVAMYFDALQGY